MTFLTDLSDGLTAMCARLGAVDAGLDLPTAVQQLGEIEVVELLEQATRVSQAIERVKIAATGVIAARSGRGAGHSGIAQARGFRNPVVFVQHLTGGTRAEALRQIRVGEALLAGESSALPGSTEASGQRAVGLSGSLKGTEPRDPWHAPLNHALLDGALSSAQHDAIRRGLGEPMIGAAETVGLGDAGRGREGAAEAANEAWRLAATELIEEAPRRTVEELAKSARAIRDLLDPAGAEERFLARFEARSFRMWIDADGRHHGSMVFDDESAAWLTGVIDAALRPRRGGPRFVDPEAQAEATLLQADPRSNDQLAFDLVIDVLKSGTLATPHSVHGARQVGVRIVQIVDAQPEGGTARIKSTTLESTGRVVPAGVATQRICSAGVVPVTISRSGDPLNIGRDQRVYNSKQRIALAVRDGGCRWPECDRPASYCEAHHIDPWGEGGRTDIDRGILLCRFHHMQLHNNGWRITRDSARSGGQREPARGSPPGSQTLGSETPGSDIPSSQISGSQTSRPEVDILGPFLLLAPGEDQAQVIPLVPRLPLRYAWGELRLLPHNFSSSSDVGRTDEAEGEAKAA